MKYFLDTEFHEDGHTIDLISIAIVAEDGRELYLVSDEFDQDRAWANNWLAENVLPFIADEPRYSRAYIGTEILKFCDPAIHGKPEFWGYYADYDWVALCQLFGRMIDLPKGWPMFCCDLKQLWVERLPNVIFASPKDEHHALADARWNRDLYAKLHGPADRESATRVYEVHMQEYEPNTGWITIWRGIFDRHPSVAEVRASIEFETTPHYVTAYQMLDRLGAFHLAGQHSATYCIPSNDTGRLAIDVNRITVQTP